VAKSSGLGWTTLSVGDSSNVAKVIKNDITDFTFATPRAVQDITGVDKFAFERLLLLADFTISLNGVFNNTVNNSHTVFSTVSSTSVGRTTSLTVSGSNLNNTVLYTDYQLKRAVGGALTFTAPGVLSDGNVPTWS